MSAWHRSGVKMFLLLIFSSLENIAGLVGAAKNILHALTMQKAKKQLSPFISNYKIVTCMRLLTSICSVIADVDLQNHDLLSKGIGK